MQKTILPIFYMPPVSWFMDFLTEDVEILLEKHENFPKQTYRNRANIFGANGKLSLIVPIHHNGARVVRDLKVSYSEDWQKLHWKSIKTAYQSSPYFEFYEDQIKKLFEEKENFLMDLNLKTIDVFQKLLKIEKSFGFTESYQNELQNIEDKRKFFSAKKESDTIFEPYYQVFSEKIGFIKDLSIVDLLCNKGPESATYIKNIKFN